MTLTLNLNTRLLTFLTSFILISFVFFAFVSSVFAQSASPSPKQTRRDAQRVKVCQIHEKTIEKRFNSLSELVENMLAKFDAISARVQKRYTEKLVPDGKTISNYDELLSDITTKKEAVTTALNTAKASSDNFSCDMAANPKEELTAYRKNMQTVKSALKDYRKAIRNLIVAVATASGEKLKSPEATPNE